MARRESPLDEGAGELGVFAGQLRKLREQAGSPTYRQLSRNAHYSAAALSEAANGRKRPSLAVTLAYVRACGGDVGWWEERWRELAAGDRAPSPTDRHAPPYAGLAAFQVGDADRFFGRDRLVGELVELVANRRFVGVFGASGSGKSSLLRAGLAARATGPVLVVTPGARPVEELAVHVAAFAGKPPGSLVEEFTAYPQNLHLRVRQRLVAGDDDLLLVVDQLEELFTVCPDPAQRTAFLAALTTAAAAPTSRLRVVLGVRADFLGHCGRYPELVAALRGGHVLVGPMTADELREAIVEPAAAAGCKVETALVTRLVSDAAGQPAALPLVSHALLETWRRRRGMALTLTGYEAAGGVEHSVARSAEAVYLGLTEPRRALAKQVFLRLVAVDAGSADVKRRVARDEVDHPEVLAVLADARLVVLDRDTVEVAHEALIRSWPRLRDWIAEDRAGLRVQRMLTEATRVWEAFDREPGSLYRGARLAVAREWAAGPTARPTPAEARFLDASIGAQEAVAAAETRRTRRLRQLIGVLGVLLLLAGLSTVRAGRAELAATEQLHIAMARKVLSEAAGLRDQNPALALQLTLAAHRLRPLPETRDALFDAFTTPYSTRVAPGRRLEVNAARSLLALVGDGADPDIDLWDFADPHRPVRRGVVPGMGDLAFRRDGRLLAVTGRHPVLVDVADPGNPREVGRLVHPEVDDSPVSVAFAPGGRYLAVGYQHRSPVVWDLADLRRPVPGPDLGALPGLAGAAWDTAAFLTDDVLLVQDAGRIRLCRLSDPGRPVEFAPHDGRATAFAVAADARVVVTAGEDRGVDVWDFADLEHPVRTASVDHASGVIRRLALGEGGRALVVGADDRTGGIWDLTDRTAPALLTDLTGRLGDTLALGVGGRAVVVAGLDGTARLMDFADLPLGQPTRIRAVDVAAGRGLALTLDVEGVLRLADISGPRGLRTAWRLTRHPGPVLAAALSPGGDRLVTIGAGQVARVWRTTNPAAPEQVGEFPGGSAVRFSPDGAFFAVGAPGGGFDLRGTATLGIVSRARTAVDEVPGVAEFAFDPAGGRLLVSTQDGRIAVWDVSDPIRPARRPGAIGFTTSSRAAVGPGGHPVVVDERRRAVHWREVPGQPDSVVRGDLMGDVRSLAVGGSLAAAAASDGDVHLFELAATAPPREVAVLSGKEGGTPLAFGPDGHTLVTGVGTSIVLRETDPRRVEERICATAHPRMTADEWRGHFPDLPFRPPCP
ncbi:hypothetical protein ABZ816_21615 [Actinosynnema sp. NPDC047251]|uniref:HTH cro/C1-type domain-containing protein n=1 Tax=Saccharothrix espanaensis (strain ATCC 51144 / DSM 44229 / JCM 9112 / NBRC 15066 / NRRL 15764) TaxID=1179773 RepID=K0K0M4_SACES|nr:hypothetical protein [Saccharothrix espanaensis]CCH33800.1 hypothetical protein BN6_65620 [Saccharothrix espanaensis DSM 44229]